MVRGEKRRPRSGLQHTQLLDVHAGLDLPRMATLSSAPGRRVGAKQTSTANTAASTTLMASRSPTQHTTASPRMSFVFLRFAVRAQRTSSERAPAWCVTLHCLPCCSFWQAGNLARLRRQDRLYGALLGGPCGCVRLMRGSASDAGTPGVGGLLIEALRKQGDVAVAGDARLEYREALEACVTGSGLGRVSRS